jgi:hypothetical protein
MRTEVISDYAFITNEMKYVKTGRKRREVIYSLVLLQITVGAVPYKHEADTSKVRGDYKSLKI